MVRMTHTLRRPSQSQYMRHASAAKNKVTRGGNLITDTNHDVLELLYNENAIAIDGMLLGSEPCTELNRERWIPEVPLWHKTLVINELYRETRLKN